MPEQTELDTLIHILNKAHPLQLPYVILSPSRLIETSITTLPKQLASYVLVSPRKNIKIKFW